VRRKMN
jgi:U3 small nucleolar RNA-associated protein 25